MVTPSFTTLFARLAPLLLIVAFFAVQIAWALADQRVWPWDPALYGVLTLQLWGTRLQGVGGWFNSILHASGGNPPIILWLGQFLVPLGHLISNVEAALHLVNIAAAAATLSLVYLTSRRLGATMGAGLAGTLVAAGSPVFNGLAHFFMLEQAQCFGAAALAFVVRNAKDWPLLRTISLALLAVSISFLGKASSGSFVLPLLIYMIISLLTTANPRRRLTFRGDVAFLFAALIAAGLTTAWYIVHWSMVVSHFIAATVSEVTLYWGSPVHVPTKLAYWTRTLASTLSPFALLAMCLAGVTAVALLIGVVRSFRRPFMAWLEAIVESGALFALTLAGTVLATVVAFSLQINEDSRFLLPLVPLVSVLLAWSLAVLRSRMVTIVVVALLAANTVIIHAFALGFTEQVWLSGRQPPYLAPPERDARDKMRLRHAIDAVCGAQPLSRRPIFVAVEYAELNVNAANFYSEQQHALGGHRCAYVNYGTFHTDVRRALDTIDRMAPGYVLTVAPAKQPPPDTVNVTTRAVAEHLALDPRYELAPGSTDYLLIYRRKPDGDRPPMKP